MLLGLGCVAMAFLLLVHRFPPFDRLALTAMVLVSIAAMVLVRFHLRHTLPSATTARSAERIVWLTAFLAVAGTQVMTLSIEARGLVGVGFLMTAPLVAQAMLVSALLSPTISVFALTVSALLLGVSGVLPVETLTASWLAGSVGAHAVNPLKHRADLVRATTVMVATMAVIAVCVSALSTSQARIVLESAGWAAVAAIGATSIFWLAVAMLERLFDLSSDWSLLELCSPDHPLLKDLCLRAPGTYAHSVMVGNLAENAARTIGANPVLCRAMAYFHDVGKTSRPSMFIENQLSGDNPHDDLSPSISAAIIRSHVEDGLEMARRHRLPQPIRDGIAEHHGTTRIGYFYAKALEQHGFAEGDPTMERQFRYAGPKPQSRETAILHLADAVEAIARTIGRGESHRLGEAIAKGIEDRRADGQLDECDLTLRELRLIQESFLRSLCAIRHERVVYSVGESDETPATEPDHDLERVLPPPPSGTHPYGA